MLNVKPILCYFCIILFLFSNCKKQNEHFIGTTHPTNSKIKRISLYATSDTKTPINIVDEYEYNQKGQISKISSPRYQNGQISGVAKYSIYSYNTEGRLAKIENYHANLNSTTGFINLENYIYTYSTNGLKEKEVIEYPQINSFVYTTYKYTTNTALLEKYDNKGSLESYTLKEFDHAGNMYKETKYDHSNQFVSLTIYTYKNNLNTLTEIYIGNVNSVARRINKTYDANSNLVTLESKELMSYSSMRDYIHRYEYFQ